MVRRVSFIFVPIAVCLCLCLAGLGREEGQATGGGGPKGGAETALLSVKRYAYQLTNLNVPALVASPFDLFILDYSRDGTEAGRLSREEVAAIQAAPGAAAPSKNDLNDKKKKRIVLCYLSIGEAESYRYYWDRRWSSAGDGDPVPRPAWLGPSNKKWRDNYKVKYWLPEWQALVMAYLDKIIDAGFDGAYLDIIDAYEFWGEGGESGLERKSAPREMVAFVAAIEKHAREERGKKDFLIFPQNGEELSRFPEYVKGVSGIGKEDLFYDDNRPQPKSVTEEAIQHLDVFQKAGKLVLVVDYVTKDSLIHEFYQRARSHGYVPYATARQLNVLSRHPGEESAGDGLRGQAP
jgi:cysteinyl-tRNA synthetase